MCVPYPRSAPAQVLEPPLCLGSHTHGSPDGAGEGLAPLGVLGPQGRQPPGEIPSAPCCLGMGPQPHPPRVELASRPASTGGGGSPPRVERASRPASTGAVGVHLGLSSLPAPRLLGAVGAPPAGRRCSDEVALLCFEEQCNDIVKASGTSLGDPFPHTATSLPQAGPPDLHAFPSPCPVGSLLHGNLRSWPGLGLWGQRAPFPQAEAPPQWACIPGLRSRPTTGRGAGGPA